MNQSKKITLISLFVLFTISCGLSNQGGSVLNEFATPRPELPTFTPTASLLDIAVIPTDTPIPLATSIPTDTPAPPTDTPTDTPVPVPRMSVSKTINIRSGPGTNYVRIGQVKSGHSSDILGRNSDASWLFINYSEGQGWIFAELTEIEGEVNKVPEKQADAPPPPPPTPTPEPPPPPPPPPPPEPQGPSYPFKLTNVFGEKNGGITQIRGQIKDAGGQPLNGIRVRVRSGSFCTIAVPSGTPGVYPAGNYDILLRPYASDGVWLVAIVDKPTNPEDNSCDPGARQLSEEVAVPTNPVEGVSYVEFQKQ